MRNVALALIVMLLSGCTGQQRLAHAEQERAQKLAALEQAKEDLKRLPQLTRDMELLEQDIVRLRARRDRLKRGQK